MTTNPYAPPVAAVEDIPPTPSVTQNTPFFPVSITKLVVMSVCTFSLYEVYWFYENWRRISARTGEKMVPWARALFSVFYCYQCFTNVRDYDRRTVDSSKLAAGPLAAGWIVATILWKLPDPYWWLSMLAVAFLLPVQVLANRTNSMVSPGHAKNSEFSALNWVAIVLGGLFLILALLGTFLPQPSEA